MCSKLSGSQSKLSIFDEELYYSMQSLKSSTQLYVCVHKLICIGNSLYIHGRVEEKSARRIQRMLKSASSVCRVSGGGDFSAPST